MRFPFDRLDDAGRSDPDRILFGAPVRAILRAARVLVWPLPLRAGLRLSLIENREPPGPWPGRRSLAGFRRPGHRASHPPQEGLGLLGAVTGKIGASRPVRDSLRGAPRVPDLACPAGGFDPDPQGCGRRGGTAPPGRPLDAARGRTAASAPRRFEPAGRLPGATAGAGRGFHSLYLVFNHLEPKPPPDLLRVELTEAILDDLLEERLDFTTALIRQQVRVHGNLEIIAGLEGLLPLQACRLSCRTCTPAARTTPWTRAATPTGRCSCPRSGPPCPRRGDHAPRGKRLPLTCRGYDVYRTRKIGMLHRLRHLRGRALAALTLVLSWVSPSTFRLRCARGAQVPENLTPMLAGPLPMPGFEPTCAEFDDRYELTSPELRLVVRRRDFRIEVFGPGGRVAVMGGRQKDGFMNLVDTLPSVRDRPGERPRFRGGELRTRPGRGRVRLRGALRHGEQARPDREPLERGGHGALHRQKLQEHSLLHEHPGYGVFVNQTLP